MNKKLKNAFILALIILFIIAFSGSYLSLSLDNLAYVIAIGIDTSDNNNLQVTFQFSTPNSDSSSQSESESSGKTSSIIKTVDASSLSSAINLMNSYISKQINMSHCKIIVFSEELASQGISDEIFTLINDTQIRPSSNIVISKCDAKYYIESTKPDLENLIAKYYENLPNSSAYTGFITDATIGGFFNSLISKSSMPYAILGNVNSEQSESMGIAIFYHDRFVGELNALETISFLSITNDVERFLITIPDSNSKDKYIDLYISTDKSPNIEVDTSSSSPYIKIKLKFNGRIYSMSDNSDYLSPEVLETISNSCNKYLESVFSDFLYKTSKNFKTDICKFGRYSCSNFLTTNEFDNYNWLYNYRNTFFDVQVDTSVKSGMLLTET